MDQEEGEHVHRHGQTRRADPSAAEWHLEGEGIGASPDLREISQYRQVLRIPRRFESC